MLACTLWAFAYACELGSLTIPVKLFWVQIEYFGIAFVPLTWLGFVLAYTGRGSWLNRARLFWLSLPAALLILLSLTNASHHLVWDRYELVNSGGYLFLVIHHTLGFYGFVLYSNVLLLAGTGLILRLAFTAARFYRRQAILVVIGTLISWLGNLIYVGSLNPVPGLDWTPFGFALTGLLFGLAMFRYRLLDIMPVARHAILESMREGVIVLDERQRILDSNPSVETLLEVRARDVLGKPLEACLPGLAGLKEWFLQGMQGHFEIEIGAGDAKKYLEVSATRLEQNQADPVGYLILIRDVTQNRQSERSLLDSEERFRRLSEASLDGILLSENGIILDLNQQLASMLGYAGQEQELVGLHVEKFIAPEDMLSVNEHINHELEDTYQIHIFHKDRTKFPVEVRGKTLQLNGRSVRVTAVRDLTIQVRNQELLRRRDAILDAVSFVAGALLKDLEWETVIQQVLTRLGRSAVASRAYLFEVDPLVGDQGLSFSQRYEWVNEGISAQIDNPDLQGFSLERAGFLEWEQQLLDGKPIAGLVKDFPRSMAEFLAEEDILSLAIVPIFASKRLWGFLGFDECVRERCWSDGEIEALEAAANTLGAAIQRQNIESALRVSEKRYRTMVDAARDVIFTLTPNGRISNLNPAFEEITGWKVKEWLGRSFIRLIDSPDVEITNRIIREVQDGDSLPVFDAAIRTRSGAPVIMEFKAVIEREFGKIREIRGVARDITGRVQMERSLKQRMEELAALNETSLEINAQRDLSNLLQAIVNRACRLVGAPMGGIYLIRFSGEDLILAVSHHFPDQSLGAVLKIGEGLAGKVLANRELLMIPDVRAWEEQGSPSDVVRFRRALGVPLKIGEQIIGVILVGDDQHPGPFSRDEIRLVSLFADQAAIAIENVRLMETEHQRVEELDGLRATYTEISRELDLNTLLGKALERAVTLTEATGGELGLYIEQDQEIEIVASYNMGRVMTGARIAVGEGAMGIAVERRESLVIMDYGKWHGRSSKYDGIPIYAALAIPLMVGGRMVGVIGVFHADQSYRFSDAEQNLLSLFGQQAAIAVENARLFSETRRLAQIDSLTGLFNRRHFYDLAQREFNRAQRYNQPLSAIMIDVDSFKAVNDRYGHAVGDRVLKSVAQSCLSYLRSVDVVARYGGEEFIALIPNTELEGCWQIAERMRGCVAGRMHQAGDDLISVSISLGIAELEPDCASVDLLLDRADKALYLAKQAGKNRVGVWQLGLQTK